MPQAPDITITVDERDRRALIGAMDRFARETGKDLHEALRFAGWRVCQSLGATAHRAKKLRKLIPNKGTPQHPVWWWNRGQKVAVFPFYVEKWVAFKGAGGAKRPMKVYINAGEEQTHPDRKIARHGLAASSWMWGSAKLGKGMGRPTVAPMPGIVKVEQIKKMLNPAVIITNRLRYVGLVMKGGGKKSMDTAFARSARSIEHYLNNRMARRMARGR